MVHKGRCCDIVFQPHAEHVFHMSSVLVVCYRCFYMLFVFTWLIICSEPYDLSFGCRNQWVLVVSLFRRSDAHLLHSVGIMEGILVWIVSQTDVKLQQIFLLLSVSYILSVDIFLRYWMWQIAKWHSLFSLSQNPNLVSLQNFL